MAQLSIQKQNNKQQIQHLQNAQFPSSSLYSRDDKDKDKIVQLPQTKNTSQQTIEKTVFVSRLNEIFKEAITNSPKILEAVVNLTVANLVMQPFGFIQGIINKRNPFTSAVNAGANFIEKNRAFFLKNFNTSAFGSDQEFAIMGNFQAAMSLNPMGHIGNTLFEPSFEVVNLCFDEACRSIYNLNAKKKISYQELKTLQQTDPLFRWSKNLFHLGEASASLAVILASGGGTSLAMASRLTSIQKILGISTGMSMVTATAEELLNPEDFNFQRFIDSIIAGTGQSLLFMSGISILGKTYVKTRLGTEPKNYQRLQKAIAESRKLTETVDFVDGHSDLSEAITSLDRVKSVNDLDQLSGALMLIAASGYDVADYKKLRKSIPGNLEENLEENDYRQSSNNLLSNKQKTKRETREYYFLADIPEDFARNPSSKPVRPQGYNAFREQALSWLCKVKKATSEDNHKIFNAALNYLRTNGVKVEFGILTHLSNGARTLTREKFKFPGEALEIDESFHSLESILETIGHFTEFAKSQRCKNPSMFPCIIISTKGDHPLNKLARNSKRRGFEKMFFSPGDLSESEAFASFQSSMGIAMGVHNILYLGRTSITSHEITHGLIRQWSRESYNFFDMEIDSHSRNSSWREILRFYKTTAHKDHISLEELLCYTSEISSAGNKMLRILLQSSADLSQRELKELHALIRFIKIRSGVLATISKSLYSYIRNILAPRTKKRNLFTGGKKVFCTLEDTIDRDRVCYPLVKNSAIEEKVGSANDSPKIEEKKLTLRKKVAQDRIANIHQLLNYLIRSTDSQCSVPSTITRSKSNRRSFLAAADCKEALFAFARNAVASFAETTKFLREITDTTIDTPQLSVPGITPIEQFDKQRSKAAAKEFLRLLEARDFLKAAAEIQISPYLKKNTYLKKRVIEAIGSFVASNSDNLVLAHNMLLPLIKTFFRARKDIFKHPLLKERLEIALKRYLAKRDFKLTEFEQILELYPIGIDFFRNDEVQNIIFIQGCLLDFEDRAIAGQFRALCMLREYFPRLKEPFAAKLKDIEVVPSSKETFAEKKTNYDSVFDLNYEENNIAGFPSFYYDSIGFTVIGQGELGDKANQLLRHAAAIQQAGRTHDISLRVPETVVLSQQIIEEILSLAGLGNDLESAVTSFNQGIITKQEDHQKEVEERILQTLLSLDGNSNLKKLLSTLVNDYFANRLLLFTRSSGKGDAAGHGTYRSLSCFWNENDFFIALAQVISSYFLMNAKELRRKGALGKGFGVMIQEAVIEVIPTAKYGKFYAPRISGNGIVVSNQDEHFQNVVIGAGGGVSKEPAPCKASELDIITAQGSLSQLRELLFQKISDESRLSRGYMPNNSLIAGSMNLSAILYDSKAIPQLVTVYEGFFQSHFEVHKLESFFAALRTLRQNTTKHDLYIEWAFANGTFYIVQIDTVLPKEYFSISPKIRKQALIKTNKYRESSVLGAGEKRCRRIIFCTEPQQLNNLQNKISDPNYFDDSIIVISSYLSTRARIDTSTESPDEIISRLSPAALLEMGTTHHANPQSHWLGALRLRNIFFAVIDTPDFSGEESDLPQYFGATFNSELGLYLLESGGRTYIIRANEIGRELFVNEE